MWSDQAPGTNPSLSVCLYFGKRKNHLKRKRLVLFLVFIVGINVEDTLAEILRERQNWNLTFLILNEYPQSGRTSQSHGSPSICGGWIGWSGERNTLSKPGSKKVGLNSRCKEQTLW